ncbi:hypothetical protein BJ508DRAFT_303820 [Ascobolus immersus RN42]|uniref:Uncharacterized protein n=1 Tax=Ascobolus immersus RN42 TaxID=1160509 RepID=A0A3N4IRV8_ASCIM|nr:hypothetical protein BJ508DRAFT_303820 [Ascobolus immersus RN42]
MTKRRSCLDTEDTFRLAPVNPNQQPDPISIAITHKRHYFDEEQYTVTTDPRTPAPKFLKSLQEATLGPLKIPGVSSKDQTSLGNLVDPIHPTLRIETVKESNLGSLLSELRELRVQVHENELWRVKTEAQDLERNRTLERHEAELAMTPSTIDKAELLDRHPPHQHTVSATIIFTPTRSTSASPASSFTISSAPTNSPATVQNGKHRPGDFKYTKKVDTSQPVGKFLRGLAKNPEDIVRIPNVSVFEAAPLSDILEDLELQIRQPLEVETVREEDIGGFMSAVSHMQKQLADLETKVEDIDRLRSEVEQLKRRADVSDVAMN